MQHPEWSPQVQVPAKRSAGHLPLPCSSGWGSYRKPDFSGSTGDHFRFARYAGAVQEMLSLRLDRLINLGDAPCLGGFEGQTGAQLSRRCEATPRSALALKLLRGVLRYERPSSRQRIAERRHEVALHRLTKLRIDLVCDRHHSG